MGCYKVAGEADTQAEKAGEASGKEGGGHFYQLLGAPRIDQKQTSDLTQRGYIIPPEASAFMFPASLFLLIEAQVKPWLSVPRKHSDPPSESAHCTLSQV